MNAGISRSRSSVDDDDDNDNGGGSPYCGSRSVSQVRGGGQTVNYITVMVPLTTPTHQDVNSISQS